MEPENENKGKLARRIRAYAALALVLLSLGFFGYKWYKNYTMFEKTDDAYIDADRVSVSSKMMGRIARVYAVEGDSVSAGMLLVELDSTDLVAQKMQAVASTMQAEASTNQAMAKLEYDQMNMRVQEVSVEKAQEDLDRATAQLKGNVISQEQFDHMKKAFETAQAQLGATKAQLDVSKSMIESSKRSISLAVSQVHTLQTQMRNTRIYSPASGRVAKRWLLPGDVAQPGQSVYTITKDDSLYVTAFFEETKIAGLFIGKKVEFTVDAYPGVTFNGVITYIATNTAAQFSLIPPSNASGNFTKVTQRIPIRISIIGPDNSTKYPHMKLIAGMSAFLKIPR
ncbi:MAG: HlyD family secretion protein [Bacteroidota bacterium]